MHLSDQLLIYGTTDVNTRYVIWCTIIESLRYSFFPQFFSPSPEKIIYFRIKLKIARDIKNFVSN